MGEIEKERMNNREYLLSSGSFPDGCNGLSQTGARDM